MIYRRRRNRMGTPGGFFRFMDSHNNLMAGPSDGDFVRLRDDKGTEWHGTAERQADDTVRYRFRDSDGNHVSGISDGYGVILRDHKGNTWRGFVD